MSIQVPASSLLSSFGYCICLNVLAYVLCWMALAAYRAPGLLDHALFPHFH